MNSTATKAKLATLSIDDLRYLALLVDLEFQRRSVEPVAVTVLAPTPPPPTPSPRSKRTKHL